MRWLPIVVLLLAVPGLALAKPKPKVAVAPLDNDPDDKVGSVVAEVAAAHAKVTGIDKTRKTIDDLSISLDKKGLKKLRVKLEVEVIIHGSVDKEGNKRKLELELTGHGKTKATLELTIKTQKALRATLEKTLAKKIDEVAGTVPTKDDDDDDDDKPKTVAEDEPKPKKIDDDEAPKKKVVADEDRPKRKVVADSDDTSVRKRAGDDDDDTTRHKKHHHHHEGVVEQRDVETQGWVLVDAGVEVARRTLVWQLTGADPPPPWVGAAGAAGVIGGEIYPLLTDSADGIGIGIYGEYARVVGQSITLPGTAMSVPISDGHYEIGARYRIPFGTSSIAFGGGLWKRYFVADQSALMAGTTLDMPSVNYTAIAPNAIFRFAATSSIAGFVEVEVPLVLDSGDIGSGTSYGRGRVIAFDAQGGVQIMVADHYSIDLAGGFNQVGIKYEAEMGSQAQLRGVSGSTDRSYGVSATLGVLY